jgi:hypothetical protein
MQTSGKKRCEWVFTRAWFTLAAVPVAAITIWQINGTRAAETVPISQTEPSARPDGTAAHPYPRPANAQPTAIWFFGRAVGRRPVFPQAYRSALLKVRMAGRIA